MKHVERWYAGILLAIMALIVVHAPLTVWLGTMAPDGVLVIKAWKEILMAVAGILMVILVAHSGRMRELLRDRLVIVTLGVIALHIISVIQWPSTLQVLAGLAIDLRYIVYFLLVYICIRLLPEYRQKFLRVAVAGAAVVVGLACIQLLLPPDSLKYLGYSADTIPAYQTVDQNPDFVRSQSTLRGPNPFSAYMVIVLSGAVAYVLSRGRYRNAAWLGVIASAALLYLGYSRSALIGGAVAILLLVVMQYREHLTVKRLTAIGAGVVLVGAVGIALVQTDFGSTVLLHTDPNESGQVNSDDKRLESLGAGISRILAQPFGAGVGTTGSASLQGGSSLIIENQYLFIAHEIGIVGLVLFIMLYVMVLMRLWRDRRSLWSSAVFASGVGLGIIGLFLPVWVDDTVAIVWWGLAGVLVAGSAGASPREHKREER